MGEHLLLATAQFSVSGDPQANFLKIKRQIIEAAEQGADLVHFSECCLTGYPGIDIKTCTNDPEIPILIDAIGRLAAEYNIWVIVGSHYFTELGQLPYNSLFVFNNNGDLVTRYDKRVLAGAPGEIDQIHYSAGDTAAVFTLNNISCGLIICHEWRYPELFREYQQMDVDLIFHSFYDGNLSLGDYKDEGVELGELITGGERFNAANNFLWLSVANTSRAEQAFPSMVIFPDGSIANQAQRNKDEIIFTKIVLSKEFVDPSRYGRQRVKGLFSKDI